MKLVHFGNSFRFLFILPAIAGLLSCENGTGKHQKGDPVQDGGKLSISLTESTIGDPPAGNACETYIASITFEYPINGAPDSLHFSNWAATGEATHLSHPVLPHTGWRYNAKQNSLRHSISTSTAWTTESDAYSVDVTVFDDSNTNNYQQSAVGIERDPGCTN